MSWGMQRRTGGSWSLALEKTEETEVEFRTRTRGDKIWVPSSKEDLVHD